MRFSRKLFAAGMIVLLVSNIASAAVGYSLEPFRKNRGEQRVTPTV